MQYGTGVPAGPLARTATATLNGTGRVAGATLTVAVDTTLIDQGRLRLRRVLVIASVAALLISAVLVAAVVRWSLRPLVEVSELARRITAGQRGERLRPDRTDTEIGQTASALDEMLDELEGAETRAREADQRSRRFLADAAHELRTPVAGMRAAAESLLHVDASLTPEERQQLEALVVREAGRAGRLVTDLLVVARLDAGEPARPRVPVDLSEVAAQELARIGLTHPSVRRTLTGLTEPTGPTGSTGLVVPGPVARGDADAGVAPDPGTGSTVLADPAQVAGIVGNLLDNAVRAAGPTGEVAVTVHRLDDWICVDVVDSGPGVPEADRERIFERLVRLDADRSQPAGGSGLGLAIARGHARAHDGDVRCLEPPAGSGALFRLALPAAR
jgi:signal transduction histidine kinase